MGNLNSRGKGNRRRKNKKQILIQEEIENNKLDDSFDLAEIDYK